MQNGGNRAYQDFYSANSSKGFEESTIKERYDCEVGEEWKERLTALVEGKISTKLHSQKSGLPFYRSKHRDPPRPLSVA